MGIQGIRSMLSRRAGVVFVATALGVLGSAGAASAATFTVNDRGDFPQSAAGAQTSTCHSTDNETCTLRAAVQAADETGGANTIILPAGTYTFSNAQSAANSPGCTASSPPNPCDPNDPAYGDLDVNVPNGGTDITVLGAGSGSTVINPNGLDRAFNVHVAGGLSLQGVTIENGYTATNSSPSDHSSDAGDGGAVYSNGALTVGPDAVLAGNDAYYDGGAVFSGSDLGSTLSITGATFKGNEAYDNEGGAIYYNSPNTAQISGSTFTTNQTYEHGGAIASEYGSISIDSSSLTNNAAYEYGGALYWDNSSTLKVTNSTITGNTAGYYGGALVDYDSQATILSNDIIDGNSSTYDDYGGALYLDGSGDYTINQDIFDSNVSGYGGGALVWYDGNSLTITGSTFTNNDGGWDGGAMYLDDDAPFTMINSTLTGNSANYGGGIELGKTTPVSWANDTIAYNTGAGGGDGGGIYGASDMTTSNYTPPPGTTYTAGVVNTVVAQNTGWDCDSNDGFAATVEPLGHNMDSDKSCFGANAVQGDIVGVTPNLGQPANNGGPVAGNPNTGQQTILTDSDLGTPAIDAGTDSSCPSTDERGVARPQGAACDIGAYEAAAAGLSMTMSAPTTAAANSTFQYTVTLTNGGPAASTGTTLADTVPAGERLWAATPSQGSCSLSGGTSTTCALGQLASGASATVTLVVSDGKPGTVATNTATASNDQASHASAAASTTITGTTTTTTPTTKPKKPGFLGRLLLDGTRLVVRNGKVGVKFTCQSSKLCSGLFSVTTRLKLAKSRKLATIVCTVSQRAKYRIGAHKTRTVHVPIHASCMSALKSHHRGLVVKITTRPRTAQKGLVKKGRMILK